MNGRLAIADGIVDLDGHCALRDSGEVALTRLDVAFLRCLAHHAPEPVPRTTLLAEVWKLAPNTRTEAVEQEVRRLRAKIETNPRRPQHLKSVYGAGYQWVPYAGDDAADPVE